MAKKAARDPGCPKRNMSAYLLYQNAMREQFKALNPGMTFGQLSKYTSAMYSELPPSEKEAWVARAEADKARYLHELASYVPPPGYDPKGDPIVPPVKSGRKGKPEKDINAPKRNMSAYLLYQNAMREHFKRENPGMTFGQLAKYTSHMYKNLTVDEKATWDGRAAQDKARYDTQLVAYVPPPGHDARGVLIEDNRPRRRNKRGPKDPLAPKRASGAYVCFTNDMRPKLHVEYPGIKFIELGKVLGERWRALTPEQKKVYEGMAAQDKVRFQLAMQQYTANQAAAHPALAATEYEAYTQHADPYAQHTQYHQA
jgi:high mobility group protein B2